MVLLLNSIARLGAAVATTRARAIRIAFTGVLLSQARGPALPLIWLAVGLVEVGKPSAMVGAAEATTRVRTSEAASFSNLLQGGLGGWMFRTDGLECPSGVP